MIFMNIFKQLLGLLLIVTSLIDPFELGSSFQVLFFILGFDLTGLILKLLLFAADMFFKISGLGWYLAIFIAVEVLFNLLNLKKLLGYVVKPMVVFLIIFMNGFGWELGIIVGGIDLLLNFSKKYI